MKAFAYLQLTLMPADRQKVPSSSNRPVSEIQWEAIKRILHMGKTSADVVALPDVVSPAVSAMLKRLCREQISCDKRTIQEVWHHLKHAIVSPDDVCVSCAAVASFGEPHEETCEHFHDEHAEVAH